MEKRIFVCLSVCLFQNNISVSLFFLFCFIFIHISFHKNCYYIRVTAGGNIVIIIIRYRECVCGNHIRRIIEFVYIEKNMVFRRSRCRLSLTIHMVLSSFSLCMCVLFIIFIFCCCTVIFNFDEKTKQQHRYNRYSHTHLFHSIQCTPLFGFH